jgi:hypothetical protein
MHNGVRTAREPKSTLRIQYFWLYYWKYPGGIDG